MGRTNLAGAKSQDMTTSQKREGEEKIHFVNGNLTVLYLCHQAWLLAFLCSLDPASRTSVLVSQPWRFGCNCSGTLQVLGLLCLAAVLRCPVCGVLSSLQGVTCRSEAMSQAWGAAVGLDPSIREMPGLMAPPGHCAVGAGGLLTGFSGREEVEMEGSSVPLPCAS